MHGNFRGSALSHVEGTMTMLQRGPIESLVGDAEGGESRVIRDAHYDV